MQEHLSRAVRKTRKKVWVTAGDVTVGMAEDFRAVLDEVRRRRAQDGRMGAYAVGKTAKVLMALKVGESVEVEPITMGALTSARRTARKRMENPDAVWRSYALPNGLHRIVRAPDGSGVYEKRHNPAVAVMAAMRVGETTTLTTLKGKMHNGIKIQARRRMDCAEANWKCLNLADGDIRCTRVR